MNSQGLYIRYGLRELASIFLVFALFTLMVTRGPNESLLRNFASPLAFHFLLIPVYLWLIYKHDDYFYMVYCCTRYVSERQVYLKRVLNLLLETIIFSLPLLLVLATLSLLSNICALEAVIYGLSLFVGLLQLGLVFTILHQTTRTYYLGLLLYSLLIFDAWSASGGLFIDSSIYYQQLLLLPLYDQTPSLFIHLLTHLLKSCVVLGALFILGLMLANKRRRQHSL